MTRDLYERVVEDPAIKELILKAQGFTMQPLIKPVVVMECRGRNSEGNLVVHPRLVYANKREYAEMFTERVRAGFNGRTIVHETGSRRFYCLTDIVDNAPAEKQGKWFVVGKTGEDFLEKDFIKKEDLDKELPAVLNAIDDYALVHKYGTTDYLLIEASATVKMEKPRAENIEQDISASLSKYQKLEESEIEITEPPEIDLREEELKELEKDE